MAEITRKSVLLECLQIMRREQEICSTNYNGLEPKKGMEEAWEQGRQKIKILEDLIQAYETEPVRKALADWQLDVMENGASALDLNVGPSKELLKQILDSGDCNVCANRPYCTYVPELGMMVRYNCPFFARKEYKKP